MWQSRPIGKLKRGWPKILDHYTIRQQARSDKQEIKQLRRELRHKEKALAEAAALLVLRKKLNALWDTNSNEDE